MPLHDYEDEIAEAPSDPRWRYRPTLWERVRNGSRRLFKLAVAVFVLFYAIPFLIEAAGLSEPVRLYTDLAEAVRDLLHQLARDMGGDLLGFFGVDHANFAGDGAIICLYSAPEVVGPTGDSLG